MGFGASGDAQIIVTKHIVIKKAILNSSGPTPYLLIFHELRDLTALRRQSRL